MRAFLQHFLLYLAVLPLPLTSSALELRPSSISTNAGSATMMIPTEMQLEFIAPMNSPRFMTIGPDNELLVGSRSGIIYRFSWPYTSPDILTTLNGYVHSLAFRDDTLIVAMTNGLYSMPYTGLTTVASANDFKQMVPLPAATGGHSSRTVIVGPDNRLFVSLGISGNCPNEFLDLSYDFEHRRGGVFVLDESVSSTTLVPYSSGLRNPVGLAFHPQTKILYATNAGPDNLGFDRPPEVFAKLSPGSFHGMPWYQYYDGVFQNGDCATSSSPREISETTVPAATFLPRSTPLGLAFVPNTHRNPLFQGNVLVAIHGSWAKPADGDNTSRRPPKIAMVRFLNHQATTVEDVITGFQLADGSRFARPAAVIIGPDSNLYFTSDDGEVTGLFSLSLTPDDTPTQKIPIPFIYNLLLDQ